MHISFCLFKRSTSTHCAIRYLLQSKENNVSRKSGFPLTHLGCTFFHTSSYNPALTLTPHTRQVGLLGVFQILPQIRKISICLTEFSFFSPFFVFTQSGKVLRHKDSLELDPVARKWEYEYEGPKGKTIFVCILDIECWYV